MPDWKQRGRKKGQLHLLTRGHPRVQRHCFPARSQAPVPPAWPRMRPPRMRTELCPSVSSYGEVDGGAPRPRDSRLLVHRRGSCHSDSGGEGSRLQHELRCWCGCGGSHARRSNCKTPFKLERVILDVEVCAFELIQRKAQDHLLGGAGGPL